MKIEIWLMLQRDLYILTMLVYACIQSLSREIYLKNKINYITHLEKKQTVAFMKIILQVWKVLLTCLESSEKIKFLL